MMFNAKTRALGLSAVVLALILAPAAEAKSKHPYEAHLLFSTLKSDNGYPGVGGTALLSGALDSSEFGPGAVVDHATITGQEANVLSFEGREIDYFARGTQRDRFTGTATIEGDGSQTIVVHGRYTGGTGRYMGATGHYTFEGTVPPGGSVTTGSSTGVVRF